MEPHQAPLEIGMLLYPGLTLQDLIGPQTVWSWHANTHLLWKTRDLIVSDSGIAIQPTATFSTCPNDLDVLFVPGGLGTVTVMQDHEILDFLVARAAHAAYVTSVCTGSLILGAPACCKDTRPPLIGPGATSFRHSERNRLQRE
jgi:cyclohexyl-isocyanide hydratase